MGTIVVRQILVSLVGLATTMISAHTVAADSNKACSLTTPAEIESVLGSSVALSPTSSGKAEFCTGQTPSAKVLLRLVTGLDPEEIGRAARKRQA